MSQLRPLYTISAFAMALVLTACGGGDAPESDGAAAPDPAGMAAGGAAEAPEAGSMALPAGVTSEMVSAGGALFPTQICASCHGPNGQGLDGLGPNLTDSEWLNSDGSFDAIVQTITNGVPEPRSVPVPMPAKGGNAALTDQQVRELAAWIYAQAHSM